MHVNNEFLHGHLTKTVYMIQSPGFKDHSKHCHVCKLRKAICGLKQAQRVWYCTLKAALIALSFVTSWVDPSLFIYQNGSIVCYLLVYVDDLVLIVNDSSFVQSIVTQLGTKFLLKDMGTLHYFLGMKVLPTHVGLSYLSINMFITYCPRLIWWALKMLLLPYPLIHLSH